MTSIHSNSVSWCFQFRHNITIKSIGENGLHIWCPICLYTPLHCDLLRWTFHTTYFKNNLEVLKIEEHQDNRNYPGKFHYLWFHFMNILDRFSSYLCLENYLGFTQFSHTHRAGPDWVLNKGIDAAQGWKQVIDAESGSISHGLKK